MGKIRIKTIGIEEIEQEQKKAAEKRQESKKSKKGIEATFSDNQSTDVDDKKPDSTESTSLSPKARKKTHQGKSYKKAVAKAPSESMQVEKAVEHLKKMSYAKFDETIELHLQVQNTGLKGELLLPHGTGKSVKVAIVDDSILAQLENGTIDFDVLIARPADMTKLAKYAKLLGPRGLMPNPKLGTISESPEDVVKKFSGGTVRYKTEAKFPLIHLVVGKASFEDKKLVENINEALKGIGLNSISSAHLTGSMTPSIALVVQR